MYTLKSKVEELYQNPTGHDVINKILLQIGIPRALITNPLVGAWSLSAIRRLTKKWLEDDFFNVLLQLLNQSPEAVKPVAHSATKAWWKEAVFYQIYPRSFMDANGDGVGDLQGIISRLDYLKDLGVDAVWLSPVYDSPGDDNGYDIRDYYKIAPEFGSMEEFDLLLAEVHHRGMRLVMDLVVNHTSDEHAWFQEALHNPESPFREFYFLRPSPNNWTSFFGGSAWNEYPKQGVWGMHLFSPKQMDLNWENADMRREVYKMIRWWLEKGVDGFRLDVINYISKAEGLPQGNTFIGKLMGFTGIEHYFHGPHLHRYLREMRREAFAPYQAFSVGETPGVGMEIAKLLTDESREELDMIFSFDHLEMSGHARFDIYKYDLNYYRDYIIDWMEHYGDTSWMSLFYDNHDNPRMLSKIDPAHGHRKALAKLLALMQMTLRGTPFIYQGQEIGMINKAFKTMDDFRDVETLHKYQELAAETSKEEAFRHVLAGSRDHSRTPMQWSSGSGGGFSEGIPWIKSDGDEAECNVEQQQKDGDSVLTFYKKIIALRKRTPALVYGQIAFAAKKRKNLLVFTRKAKEDTYLIVCNLGAEPMRLMPPKKGNLILSTCRRCGLYFKPYEARIYRILNKKPSPPYNIL